MSPDLPYDVSPKGLLVPDGEKLFPHQEDGVTTMLGMKGRVLLADEPGLGKTIQALALIDQEVSLWGPKRILIMCPASLRMVWESEIERWGIYERSYTSIKGLKKISTKRIGSSPVVDFVICSYTLITKQKIRQQLMSGGFNWIICDEAHALKNLSAKQTKLILGDYRTHGLVDHAGPGGKGVEGLLCLTGTPIANRPIDLWPVVNTLSPGLLGEDMHSYALEHCGAFEGKWGWDYSGKSNLGGLHQKLKTVMVRRKKVDVMPDLPPRLLRTVFLDEDGAKDLIKRERVAFEVSNQGHADSSSSIVDAMRGKFGGVASLQEEGIEMDSMSTLRREIGESKVDSIVGMVADLVEDRGHVVVMCWHRSVVVEIHEALTKKKISSAKIYGATSDAGKRAVVDSFQRGELSVVVCNMSSAGTGITLTRSSTVVFAELDWTPSNVWQALDRCHRIGQGASCVEGIFCVYRSSLEAHMAKLLTMKDHTFARAIDGT